MLNVGVCYDNGEGVTQDKTKAFEWFLKSAKSGCVDGMNTVGFRLCRGIGVSRDLKKAREWFAKASKNEEQSQKKQ